MKTTRIALKRAGIFMLFALLILVFSNCKNSQKSHTKIDPGFADFVTAFTSGVVSSETVIRIKLASDFPGAKTDGSAAVEQLFSFSPSIKGKAYWIDKRTLEFRPEEKLESGMTYDGEFLLSKIITVPSRFKVFPFQFQVINQNFSIENEGLWVPDERNTSVYQLKGNVITADVINGKELEELIQANYNGKSLKVSWIHDADRKTHHYLIDSISRGKTEAILDLAWDGEKINVKRKGNEKVEIPAGNTFKITSLRVVQDPEQYIILSFSDPLLPDQLLDGLVRLGTHKDLKFTIESNKLKVFLPERLSNKDNIIVDAAVKNIARNTMSQAFSAEVSFESIKPAIRLLGKGVILPNSDGLILPFEAVNLSKVDVKIVKIFENNIGQFLQVNSLNGAYELRRVAREIYKETINLQNGKVMDMGKWNTFSIDLTKIIEKDPGAIYNVIFSFTKDYSLYSCTDAGGTTSTVDAVNEENDESEDYGYDEEGYDEGYYGFYPSGYNWNDRDNPCTVSYYTSQRFVKRNILASDMGIIAKAGDKNSMIFAVTDLRTTEPVSGTTLELYDYQNQLITSGTTDLDGMLNITPKEKPWLLIAKKGRQRGYLKLDDGSSLSLSKFDVGGAVVQKGIKGTLFGERGVWRPGDTLFLTFILEDKNKQIPQSHPVSLELINPRGQLYTKQVNTQDVNGFYRFTIPTDEGIPTGNWTANVKVGGANFSKTLKIETIKPNRLKLKLDFQQKILSASTDKSFRGMLSSSWLTGAVAGNMRAVVSLSLVKDKTSFSAFPSYEFDNPVKKFTTEEMVLFDGKTDARGNAQVPATINTTHQAGGMLRANFTVRVFEESGDFSSDYFSMSYSPFSSYVGLLVPKGEKYSSMLRNDLEHVMEVATVDENGKSISRTGLEVKVIHMNWRWWWNANGSDLASYEGNFEQNTVFQTSLNTSNGRGHFKLKFNEHDWGRFLILVKDPVSGHTTGKVVYVDYPYWYRDRRQDPEAATMLNFSSDKPTYNVGEKAIITVPTGGQGRALVSIENGSKVLNTFWVKADNKETKINIAMTAEMSPNVYIHITLIQPHAQAINDLPLRLYGVIPIQVNDPATILKPKLEMPAVFKPEQTVSIKIREEKGKAMTYVLAIVDEGLLDLTRFKTPNPWDVFYAREALGVKTWDLFDLVLGAYGGKLEQAFAIGGDGDMKPGSPKKANRFKPMVIYLGPFSLKAGESAIHKVKIPQYIGSVRVMAIAGQQGAYGIAEKAVPVKKPLMVLATLPRVVGPGESVRLPITVFAMEKNIKDVKVSITTNEMFTGISSLTKTLTFKQIGDQVLPFDLKVSKKLGIARVKVTAVCGNEKAETHLELDVRNANSPETNYQDKTLEAGKPWNLNYQYIGMTGTNKAVLEVSALIPVDFERRLEWLIQYPYGCVEQTTSSAFPQLFLSDITDLSPEKLTKIQTNVKAALQKLRSFQQSNGGFSYWPGSSGVDDWASIYVGHFILEAEAKGFTLPAGMKESWLRYSINASKSWSPARNDDGNTYNWWDVTQAYRLAVLAQAGNPQLAAMNQLKEKKNLSTATRFKLALAYHYAGQKNVSTTLILNRAPSTRFEAGMAEVYGSIQRDKAMALEALVALGDMSQSFLLARDLVKDINSDMWFSTQSAAYSLMAISKYLKMAGGNGKVFSFTYKTENGTPVTVNCKKPFSRIELPVSKADGSKISVINNANATVYVRLVLTGTPEAGKDKNIENNLRMNVVYKDMKGNILNVSKLVQGMDFYADVTISHPGLTGTYRNMALKQVFPSGWEIVNLRMSGSASTVQSDTPTYEDIRDDRVLTFFDLPGAASRHFVVLLNATYLGKFYLPGPYCEAMYDNKITAARAGKWVEVVER